MKCNKEKNAYLSYGVFNESNISLEEIEDWI